MCITEERVHCMRVQEFSQVQTPPGRKSKQSASSSNVYSCICLPTCTVVLCKSSLHAFRTKAPMCECRVPALFFLLLFMCELWPCLSLHFRPFINPCDPQDLTYTGIDFPLLLQAHFAKHKHSQMKVFTHAHGPDLTHKYSMMTLFVSAINWNGFVSVVCVRVCVCVSVHVCVCVCKCVV